MRAVYASTGIVLVLIIGAAYFFSKPNVAEEPTQEIPMTFTITTDAFQSGAPIPARFTCDADDISPRLMISGVPHGAKSLVLVMDDPDIPKNLKADGVFDHWVMYGIPPDTTEIPEGASVGASGLNGTGEAGYMGPCPPKNFEPTTHRYFFRLYAVDITLNFIKAPTKAEVLAAIEGHSMGTAELMGTYDRTGN